MIEGACLCGKITYVVEGDIGEVSHCHCSMCRRIHGAAFATYGAVPRDKFRWLSGSDLVQVYRSSDSMDRTFCSNCGSTLQALFEKEPDVLFLALGTTNSDPNCRPSFHIFVGSKAPWYKITDDLPQHDTWSDKE
jgi:hypothetical protein